MNKNRALLSELEDRILAMAEGEWIDLEVGTAILEQWFARRIEVQELENALNRLVGATLMRARVHGNSLAILPDLADEPLELVEIRATPFGELYLAKLAASSGDT